ncbi:MAG TPA: DsbA family oxidoreductase [Polyangia bacterium]|nr:DsbA family oxidoreductase [Polyangia bacterium]
MKSTESAESPPLLQIDLFADVVCPWCFLGSERLERVLTSLGQPARVVHHPFMLDPNTPPEGDDVPARLRRKYRVPPEQLWARLEAEARKSDLQLDLSKQRWSYPTARAHTLIRHAAAKGTQRALVRALYQAYFQDARNIHDPATLADIAAPHGFDSDEVTRLTTDQGELAETHEEARAAAAAGVDGVPLFVFGQRLAVAGAQPEIVIKGAIEQALTGNQ